MVVTVRIKVTDYGLIGSGGEGIKGEAEILGKKFRFEATRSTWDVYRDVKTTPRDTDAEKLIGKALNQLFLTKRPQKGRVYEVTV